MDNGSTINEHGVEGYLSLPEQPGPGVIILHDWFGLLPHIKHACDELAGSGFAALAPDLYQGRTTTDTSQAEILVNELDVKASLEHIDAAIRRLRSHPQVSPDGIGAIGYSNGGWLMLNTAAAGSLAAAVVYYATIGPEEAATITCPMLGHFAEVDAFEPDSAKESFLAELGKQGTLVEHQTYPATEHSFANADAAAYVPDASREAWSATVAFLRRHLG